ncbi:MAG: tyrosine-protein phosphatase [Pseudomonadota bacterium]
MTAPPPQRPEELDLARPDPLRPDLTQAAPASARDARRASRRARARDLWDGKLRSRAHRLRAWLNMLFVDHGALRAVYLNLHPIGEARPPRAWRSAQPLPGQIARLARRTGLRAVVSLRGGVLFGSYPLEREACARLGVAFRRAVLRSRDLPSREELRALVALMRGLETPVLFHCKSGADRAGLMAALWRIVMEGASADAAASELSLARGHLSSGPTGVLDAFLQEAARAEAAGVPFLDWIETGYDRDAIRDRYRASARARGPAAWITDRLLRRE